MNRKKISYTGTTTLIPLMILVMSCANILGFNKQKTTINRRPARNGVIMQRRLAMEKYKMRHNRHNAKRIAPKTVVQTANPVIQTKPVIQTVEPIISTKPIIETKPVVQTVVKKQPEPVKPVQQSIKRANPRRNIRRNPRRNPRRNQKQKAFIPRAPRVPRIPRAPIDDQFVETLYKEDVAQDHVKMEDGSWVVQIKSATQKGATCPSMALRSGQFILNYFLTGNIGYLKRIQNTPDMNEYIKQMSQKNIPHTNLHSGEIENILDKNRLLQLEEYNKTNNILVTANEESATIIDEYRLMDLLENVQNIVNNIKNNYAGFYHCFIVRLGASERIIKDLRRAVKSGGHWISISVTKQNGKLYWFVCESGAGNRVNIAKVFAEQLLASRKN